MYRQSQLNHPDSNLSEMMDKLAELPLHSQPGTKWRYSVSTDVLGHLVEVVSGQSFDQFLQDRILGPLGMEDTAFYVTEEKLDRLASIYGPSPDGGIAELDNVGVNSHKRPHTFLSGGGGLVSTASDYMRFCQMMLNGGALDDVRLLSPKTVELMTANNLGDELMPFAIYDDNPDATKGCGFGLGVRVVVDLPQHGTLGSEGLYGWSGAASTVFWIDPKEEFIAIFLTQFMPSSTYRIRRDFQTLAYQAMVA